MSESSSATVNPSSDSPDYTQTLAVGGGLAITSRSRVQTDALHPSDETEARVELATKQYHDWKEIFSGALNDKQLLCGILLILLFYVSYSIFNIAVIGNDEDKDSEGCQCTLSQRVCLHIIIAGFYLCWVACFTVIIIYDFYKLFRNQSTDSADSGQTGDKFSELDDKLTLYENYLWLEFYKAYSVGSGVYENRSHSPSDDAKPKHKYGWLLKFYENFANEVREAEEQRMTKYQQNEDETDGVLSATAVCYEWLQKFYAKIKNRAYIIVIKFLKTGEKTAQQSYYVLYPFLVIVRLLAQLTLIPILLLQMLNRNTWICITEDDQCRNAVASSQLGLYQAYMTFSFYIALLVAILTSTMLRWFPQAKAARDACASSFM